MVEDRSEKPEKRPGAVAVKYDGEKDSAPRVVAKGRGLVAEKIIETAKEHGITIVEDADLLEVLARVDLEEEIPSNLYEAVAEVLAFVYRINLAGKRLHT